MKLFSLFSALVLSLSLYSSVSSAACAEQNCNDTTCTDHNDCTSEQCECSQCDLKRAIKSGTTTEATTPATATDAKTTTTGATNYQVTMAKDQMHCSDCATKVSEALKGLPEVDKGSVKVLLKKNTATLQIMPGSKVTAEQIKAAIETKTGYTVSKVETLPTKTSTK